jgi:hypothetical protein
MLISRKIIIILASSKNKKSNIIKRVKFYHKDCRILFFFVSSSERLKFFMWVPLVKYTIGFRHSFSHSPKRLMFNIDGDTNPMDAWQFHDVLEIFRRKNKTDLKNNRSILINKLQHMHNLNQNCYIFGTGSSLERAYLQNFERGFKIVCNTIVKDKNLMEYLKPDIIVAGDALYHFSDSLFARAFRKDLCARLEENQELIFVYPELFTSFVEKELNKFSNRIFGIPQGLEESITYDIKRKFELPAFGNVLNLLLLPLACSVSKRIYLWGFDGRSPDDVDFWKNSTKHFYQDLIELQKVEHRAFYDKFIPKGNEQDYVLQVHGDKLEEVLSMAEECDFKFYMMHSSYTTALNKRINVGENRY